MQNIVVHIFKSYVCTSLLMNRKKIRKYPNFFSGQVKYLPTEDTYFFFYALSCMQYALEKIPKARTLFDNLVLQFSSMRFQMLFNRIDKQSPKLARIFVKFINLYICQDKRRARIFMIPHFVVPLPFFLSDLVFFKYVISIHRFICEVFSRNPKQPTIKGSPRLFFAVSTAA